MGELKTLEDVLAEHDGFSFDMTTPRQYTGHGGWNATCECGQFLGAADRFNGHVADAVRAWLVEVAQRDEVVEAVALEAWGALVEGDGAIEVRDDAARVTAAFVAAVTEAGK